MAQGTDVIGWEIERGGRLAVVRENGHVESRDPGLLEYLSRRLREPVVVERRRPQGQPDQPIRLVPGDGRYVVARVRALVEEDPSLQITGIVWES